MRTTAVVVAWVLASTGFAFAQSSPPAPEAADGRYSFSRSGDDFLRLDKTTGQVSRCTERSSGWACQTVPEERAAFENEIARLQDENADLKKQLAEAAPPSKDTPKTAQKGYRVPEPQIRLPTNEDIDRAIVTAGKVWKRLVQMLNDVRSDMREKI
jgi:hypothetical protein